MAEYDDYEEETEESGPSPRDLRKQLAAEKKARKDLEAQFEKLSRESRTRTVADVLASKGVPAKVAKLIPSDVDATSEAIDSWLTEFADVFGTQQTEAAAEEVVDEATVHAHERIANADANAVPAGKIADLESKLLAIDNADDLRAFILSGGQ